MGMTIPQEYGGAGADTVSYALAIEELTRIDSSVAITVAAHHSLGTLPIFYYGTEEQKRRCLPKPAPGELVGAIAMTEPSTGSDLQSIKAKAIKARDEYVIGGSKPFIPHGRAAGPGRARVRPAPGAAAGARAAHVWVPARRALPPRRPGPCRYGCSPHDAGGSSLSKPARSSALGL